MDRLPKPASISQASEIYLDAHGHSLEAQLHVRYILSKFEFMVGLLIDRTMVDLEVPDNVRFLPVREKAPDNIA